MNILMYVLWISAIIAILLTTFTSFKYEDLNLLAIILFVFALINSFLVVSKNKDQ